MSLQETDLIDYFNEYKSLGGKKNRTEYYKNVEIFFSETYDLFVFGDPIEHDTRDEAIEAVIVNAGISLEEFDLIFESVDNVTAYT